MTTKTLLLPNQSLFYGSAQTPLVRIVPDAVYPNTWRVIWPDGRVSDLANISRIKDAAMVICTHGPPPRNPQRLHWKLDRSNSPPEAPYARSVRHGLSGGHPVSRSAFLSHHQVSAEIVP
jgi:hypothetical protein